MNNNLILTFDLDWCNDEILSYVLDKLIPNKVPATFFVTHDTKLLHTIRKYDFFELGIHPNFNSGSSHGDNYKDVIDYCLHIVPEAISSRSHGLNISSNILIYMMEKGIKIDSSIFMPDAKNIDNFYFSINGLKILRCPYNWEDDYWFYQEGITKYRLSDIMELNSKILNFHPIYVHSSYDGTKYARNNINTRPENMLDDIVYGYLTGELVIKKIKDSLYCF